MAKDHGAQIIDGARKRGGTSSKYEDKTKTELIDAPRTH